MKIILLDTNFLMYCAKYRIDIFTEIDRICDFQYKICVLDKTIKELEKLKPKELNLIKRYIEKIGVLKAERDSVDASLIEESKKGTIIATQDKELKKNLVNPVIIIRKMRYLELKEQ